MKTLKTIVTPTPERDALLLVACLGADKGTPARSYALTSSSWAVEADGKRVIFSSE